MDAKNTAEALARLIMMVEELNHRLASIGARTENTPEGRARHYLDSEDQARSLAVLAEMLPHRDGPWIGGDDTSFPADYLQSLGFVAVDKLGHFRLDLQAGSLHYEPRLNGCKWYTEGLSDVGDETAVELPGLLTRRDLQTQLRLLGKPVRE